MIRLFLSSMLFADIISIADSTMGNRGAGMVITAGVLVALVVGMAAGSMASSYGHGGDPDDDDGDDGEEDPDDP